MTERSNAFKSYMKLVPNSDVCVIGVSTQDGGVVSTTVIVNSPLTMAPRVSLTETVSPYDPTGTNPILVMTPLLSMLK